MRRVTIGIAVLALAMAACGEKKSKGAGKSKAGAEAGGRGGATAEEVARKFAAAAGKRDRTAAERCLMSEAECKLVPAPKRAECPGYLQRVHAALDDHLQNVPKGFVPGKVKVDPKMPSGKGVTFYEVFPKGGGKSVGVVVGALGGRYYVYLPVKMKAPKKRSAMHK